MKKLVLAISLLISYSLHAQQTDTIPGPIVHIVSGDVRGVTAGGAKQKPSMFRRLAPIVLSPIK